MDQESRWVLDLEPWKKKVHSFSSKRMRMLNATPEKVLDDTGGAIKRHDWACKRGSLFADFLQTASSCYITK